MRKALLDTDILSEILKGKNETVRQRAAAYQAQLGDLTICAVTVMEVVKGLHRLGREEAIERFLSGLSALQVVPVDTEVATLAGRIYADLERAGRPIGRATGAGPPALDRSSRLSATPQHTGEMIPVTRTGAASRIDGRPKPESMAIRPSWRSFARWRTCR
jgi:tRNA(fMet)-specific endonuclease VapC